jgi:hypothetical protein
MQDAGVAVGLYTEGGHWRCALHAVYNSDHPGLMQSALAPAAARAAAQQLKDMRADHDRIAKYWLRLKALRTKRLAMAETVGAYHGARMECTRAEWYTTSEQCQSECSHLHLSALQGQGLRQETGLRAAWPECQKLQASTV